ncbi:MAG: hypothetical protein MJB14_18430 [Spirochaetes bacterium]|nr:hypothetical protein [Spirochaetota bacterium]
MKKLITLLFMIFLIHKTSPIILTEKIKIHQQIKEAASLIEQKNYQTALSILLAIKQKYPKTEFLAIANYYLGLIEFQQKKYFDALFYSEQALKSHKTFRITPYYQNKFHFLSAQVYQALKINDKAIYYYLKCLSDSNQTAQLAYLNLAKLYLQNKNYEYALFYLKRVKKGSFLKDNQELYQYLKNVIPWQQIDTTQIGYHDPNINSLVLDKDTLYIGLWNGGIIKYNYILEDYQWITTDKIIANEVRSIFLDKRFLYIGTQNGFTILDKRDHSYTHLEELNNISISTICADQNFLYIGTIGNGLFIYDKKSLKIVSNIKEKIINISKLFILSDQLVISTFSGSLYQWIDSQLKLFYGMGKPTAPITDVLIKDQYCWFSTYGEGIYLFDRKKNKFSQFYSGNSQLSNDYCLCIASLGDTIICGTLGDGIFSYFGEKWQSYPISDLYLGEDIQDIVVDDDFLFIATLGEGILIKQLF